MTSVDHLPDEILRKILSRLPPKPMGQSRCVSKHWNHLISDASFMMSRPSSRLSLCRDGSHPYNPTSIEILGGLHLYGFGYGAAPDEMKLVRFRRFGVSGKITSSCEVLNLKTRSWSQPGLTIPDGHFEGYIGTFLKGYLYWMISSKIMSLDVHKMVISYLHQPDSTIDKESYLGTCNGRLWMITNTDAKTLKFDVWVMKEQGVGNSWSKTCSFAVGLERPSYFPLSRCIRITEDGRIIVFLNKDDHRHMFIYDKSKQLYKLLECQGGEEEEEEEWGIKYKESLISPMNLCRV